jgi:hypothetical protein
MAKLIDKTLAVMLMLLGSGLLLETSARAEDSSMSEPATASAAPAVVEQVASPPGARDDSQQQQGKEDKRDKEELTASNPSPLSLPTLDEDTHPNLKIGVRSQESGVTGQESGARGEGFSSTVASESSLGTNLENTIKTETSNPTQAQEPVTKVSELTVGFEDKGNQQDNKELAQSDSSPLPLPSVDEYTNPELDNTLDPDASEDSPEMEQVTNVTELSDVQPTDWAFEALRSMVERYGCIEGYPDRTYRGNRAMSRYEFAAGLNRCLDRISELITANSNYVTKEDIARLQRLQEEYAGELAQLKGRVDTLEARTTTLEGRQFSTTTKLGGLVLMHLADAFGEKAGPANNTILSYEANLLFLSSFTGKDLLTVNLGAGNTAPTPPTPPGFPAIGRQLSTAVDFPSPVLTSQGVLTRQTDETRFLIGNSEGFADNSLFLSQLQYQFPLGDKLRVTVDAYASNRILSAPITPYNDPFTGAVSFFGKINPILYPIFLGSGVGVSWKTTPWLNLDFYYGSEFGVGNVPSGGLFNAGYAASGRAAINLGALRFAFNYIHGYSPASGVNTYSGSNAAKVLAFDPTGTPSPVVSNTYVLGGFYRFTPTLELGASAGLINARTLGEGVRGDAQVWDYRVNLAFYDLGKKGNFGGIIFGMQPKLTGTSNPVLAQAIGYPAGQRSDKDTGFHIEAFYSYRVSDNISITPGVVWLTAPNHDARNPDVVVGVIRTTFGF